MKEMLGHFALRAVGVIWHFNNLIRDGEGFAVRFHFSSLVNQRKALEIVRDALSKAREDWIRPISSPMKEWVIDFDECYRKFQDKLDFEERPDWFKRKIQVMPEFDANEDSYRVRDNIRTKKLVKR